MEGTVAVPGVRPPARRRLLVLAGVRALSPDCAKLGIATRRAGSMLIVLRLRLRMGELVTRASVASSGRQHCNTTPDCSSTSAIEE
ncbi:hypothetical protein EON66_01715 [archaeon]|nr:MAG: hypothetical protein EON66_01715 [archaeon]